jgi:hypothetical protein
MQRDSRITALTNVLKREVMEQTQLPADEAELAATAIVNTGLDGGTRIECLGRSVEVIVFWGAILRVWRRGERTGARFTELAVHYAALDACVPPEGGEITWTKEHSELWPIAG